MKWNDRFHEVIEYIEICLQQYHEDISVKDIESIMDCSYDLFQKENTLLIFYQVHFVS